MSKLPWFSFYPSDWETDPGLRICSKAAKGLWIDLMCVAFKCEERGKFIINGRPLTTEEVACSVPGDAAANLTMLNELLAKGVARIDKRNAIYNARMVRDEQKRQLCSEAGKRGGGNPTFKGNPKGNNKGDPKVTSNVVSDSDNDNENSSSFKKPSFKEISEVCLKNGLTEQDSIWLFEKWNGNGFKNRGEPIRSFKSTIKQWIIQGDIFPSQKGNGKNDHNHNKGKSQPKPTECPSCKTPYYSNDFGEPVSKCNCFK